MKFNLIICTYKRRNAIERLMWSVTEQSVYPDEILIIDASDDDLTEKLFEENQYDSLNYIKVGPENKGLTRQRNYGIKHSNPEIEILCFLDDDIVLEKDYFKYLIESYQIHSNAIGIGGHIKDAINWKKVPAGYIPKFQEFYFDSFVRPLGQRNVLRKVFGLLSNKPPGYMPEFSHGYSTGFLPPSGKIYAVEFFMGGVASYKREIFQDISFSNHFTGYGLYEDMDFCLRASKLGELYVNTAAKVEHLHDDGGRPDHYKYGMMVIINGYYVWNVKYPNATFKASLKFWTINIFLLIIRFVNGFNKDKSGFPDAWGRLKGIIKLYQNNYRK